MAILQPGVTNPAAGVMHTKPGCFISEGLSVLGTSVNLQYLHMSTMYSETLLNTFTKIAQSAQEEHIKTYPRCKYNMVLSGNCVAIAFTVDEYDIEDP